MMRFVLTIEQLAAVDKRIAKVKEQLNRLPTEREAERRKAQETLDELKEERKKIITCNDE